MVSKANIRGGFSIRLKRLIGQCKIGEKTRFGIATPWWLLIAIIV